jgi:hypothetical protein
MDRRREGWPSRRWSRACAVLLACFGVALTLGITTLDASLAPSFAAPVGYPTGAAPRWVAIGDLNGDGKPELATANGRYETDTVSVLANRGDGTFRPKRDYATGLGTVSVAIGDLNGDGKPELAVANADADTVSVLRNRGDGTFEAHLDYATGLNPGSIAIGDLNGDGKPELATANAAGSVSVLANRGDGTFPAHLDYAAGPAPDSLAIGDLNGDGKPELATANAGANSVSVFPNRGDGSFEVKRDHATARTPLSVAIGDLNGDGKPDLATANESANSVSVLANTTSLCVVPSVTGKTVPAAKRTVARANCRLGKIRRAYSKTVKRGRVTAQKPKPYTLLRSGGKVNLVVSRGRKR